MWKRKDNGAQTEDHRPPAHPQRLATPLREVRHERAHDQVADVVRRHHEAAADAGEAEASLQRRQDDVQVAEYRHVLDEREEAEEHQVAFGVVENLRGQ